MFSKFGFHQSLEKAVASLGFDTPTPIQDSSIPPAMAGRDILACAMTGSGKTAAFVLPILHHILNRETDATRRSTLALILTPTRELASQICDHIRELSRFTPIHSAAVFGGVGIEPQRRAFINGYEIIVATPGRLLDHFSSRYAALRDLEFLVLDEADRMLDMGFLPDIRRVLSHLPRKPRQTMCFSATMPEQIVQLTREMLKDPVALNVDRPASTAHGIEQTAFPVPEGLKSKLLLKILGKEAVKSAITFTRTKHRANRLAAFLTRNGVPCACIHGNRSQSQRTAAITDFKSGKSKILVATDIAARGIDIEGLSHVINFDVPHIPEDYIHRVGRTARAGLIGDAFTLVAPQEEYDFRTIEKHLKKRLNRVVMEGFDYSERTTEKLEVPLAERLAEHRRQRSGAGRPRKAHTGASAAASRRSGTSNPAVSSGWNARSRVVAVTSPARIESAKPSGNYSRPLEEKSGTPNSSGRFTKIHRTQTTDDVRRSSRSSKNPEGAFVRFFED